MAAYYTFEDLSGSNMPKTSDNPYENLIAACSNDPAQIQARFNTHRTNRNAQQRAKLLAPDFQGVQIDEILAKLENPHIEPGFKDWRHCLVFWARPPAKIRAWIYEIQQQLRLVAPNLWITPPMDLHMTALEITHSLTAEEVDDLVVKMLPHVRDVCDYTHDHRATLVKPMLSYDAQALAVTFLPAAGESERSLADCKYTYHHLRRDLFTKVSATGVKVASRYVIPSAHLTIARFIEKKDFEGPDGKVIPAKVEKLVTLVDEINENLQNRFWPTEDSTKQGEEWVVGQEMGLEFRKGALWYGSGGERMYLGKGF